ncbi:homoserine dehydrogenase [Halosimplex pelagicum]|uniref:homoserine dehydrogenase n=1 Tax=Halosimplex pelagicum TaxID=869886 RepID=A0A7D5TCB9_9EURY|nr:homoserine dehydrogenase [Halosimplex pelagicum]QLH82829.1 homoserine dehydrogenase [Halosimplex pelagicum]
MRLAVLGAGAVGASVAELAADYGHTVTALADSSSAAVDHEGVDVATALESKRTDGVVGSADPEAALDGEYDVLVEATPTTLGDAQPGFGHARTALERDRHVVLANKGPVAERYGEVRELERESDGEVLFEATVGGAMPVLSTIADFDADHINAARGVLNGTANFILTRMAAEGLDYEHVLAEAQDLGVAEADPAFDVEGTDAALKCVIVANVLAGDDREYTLDDAEVQGIEEIPGSALDLATEDGRTVRLIGEVTPAGEVRVGPRLVPENGTLAVTGTENIVQLETEHAGRLNISGRGAGGPETASAVLADVGRLPER